MGLETALPAEGFLTTRLNHVINWARRSSLWPLPFGCRSPPPAAASS
jgi:NADH-quinone oxidoreductase subunit B